MLLSIAPDSTMFHSQTLTKMKALNNLNQLLSRVKNIFGHKASLAADAATSAEPSTDISVVSDPRLKAALADIEEYLGNDLGTPSTELRYKEYSNGACIVSADAKFSVSLVILTEAEGAAHLPDNVILLGSVSSSNDDDWLIDELGKFIVFLKKLGRTHRIQHLAIAFSKDKPDHPATVKEADVTCIRLY